MSFSFGKIKKLGVVKPSHPFQTRLAVGEAKSTSIHRLWKRRQKVSGREGGRHRGPVLRGPIVGPAPAPELDDDNLG